LEKKRHSEDRWEKLVVGWGKKKKKDIVKTETPSGRLCGGLGRARGVKGLEIKQLVRCVLRQSILGNEEEGRRGAKETVGSNTRGEEHDRPTEILTKQNWNGVKGTRLGLGNIVTGKKVAAPVVGTGEGEVGGGKTRRGAFDSTKMPIRE